MAQNLEQSQQAVQQQQLMALQVAMAKLVELPVTELAERVENEMLDNAALESKDDSAADDDFNDAASATDAPTDTTLDNDTPADDDYNDAASETDYDDASVTDYGAESDSMGDYFSQDDVPDYLQARADAETERYETPLTESASFYDELRNQIAERNLTEHEAQLVEYLIGSLDADGYLRKELDTLCDELILYHGVETTKAELERVLAVLQTFDPRGIGARTLQECLHLQLTDPDRRSPFTRQALLVVDKYFKLFMAREWDKLRDALGLDDEAMQHVRHLLTHLNPSPGASIGEATIDAAPTVVPDFYVAVDDDGQAAVSLNRGDVPELRVSRAFRQSLKEYGAVPAAKLSRQQKEAFTYARQKVDAAQTFIGLLERRQHTLLSVMRTIVRLQRPFFDEDDELLLRPMTLKDVADPAGVDISTVSRVTNSKYVQTAYGIYPLRFFFSSQFTSAEGDELSQRQVKAALRELIDAEDKRHPLADEALAAALKAKGFDVARRTVAKYRDLMGLGSARLRRER